MNVRDPFGLHRNPAIGILRATATQAALEFRERAIEAGTQAIEKGKEIQQAVGSVVESVESVVENAIESAATAAANVANQQSSSFTSQQDTHRDDDMAFNIPKNVPSFTNPQRQAEDQFWAAATGRKQPSTTSARGIMGGVGSLIDSATGGSGGGRQSLPMYKDKPYGYPSSQRSRPWLRRKRVIALIVMVLLSIFYYRGWFDKHAERVPLRSWSSWLSKEEKSGRRVDWLSRRERVVEAFELSWDAYERYAWGQDEFHPESKGGRYMASKGLGWIIVDSLDTMMLMNLTSRLSHAREWVHKSLTWDQDQDVNTFETTIRMMGGLLSAHYLSNEYPSMAPLTEKQLGDTGGEDLYLEKAKDLADRLLSAFDSPTGIPWSSVNIGKSEAIPAHDNSGSASTAEATTLQLEFKYLAKLTGEKMFWDKVENVMAVVDESARSFEGLVPIFVNPKTGQFMGQNIRLGSRGDSY